ncbi:MAG: hypothetical protein J5848_07460 [Bacteroidales bacterium]|nr:hypothetical protein [Bacteroidales bacterium]
MNHRQSPPLPKLQPISPEALVHIAALVERDNIGLSQRCARYRRRASIRRTAVAACFLALFALGADIAYANPPLYTEKAIVGNTTATQASDTINVMLSQI